MTYSNLNVNQEGYYYRNYTATYGIFYEIDFKIVFKVGNPTGSDRIPQEHLHYNYDTTWDDQLEGYESWTYDGSGNHTGTTAIQEYTYDNQGNPINISEFVYDGTTYEYAVLSWSGRELTRIDVYNYMGINEFRLEYTYNDQGYRTNKTISYNTWENGQDTFVVIKEVDYELDEDRVILEQGKEYNTSGIETLDYVIIYTYDYDGTLIGFNYEDDSNTKADYFYLRNQLGDITHILNADGLMVANYTYDAYGNIIDPFVRAGYGHIGDANAYNYRGYRYDSEINLYYLNSRYYNSEVGRFINSDGILGSVEEILTTNMYSYCLNNPINNIDPSGYWVISLIGITVSFRGMFTGGSISVYLVQDNRGNIGVLLTVAVGLNLPSAGMSVTWSPFFSWRRTIYDLKGLNGIFGASGGVGIYSAGADLLYDADGMLGIQLNIGFGVSFPINFEAHGYFAYSVLFPINRRSMIGTSSILKFVNEIKRAINTVINYGG